MAADRRPSDIEQELREAITTGTPVDLRSGSPKTDDPTNYTAWAEWRSVPATLLIELMTQRAAGQRRPRALWLAGARITEELDLRDAELVCPLALLGCWFDGPVDLSEAQAVTIRFIDCRLPSLQAVQLVTRGNLELNAGFGTQGGVHLLGANVGGFLNLTGATLTNPDGPALFADQITVTKSMVCRNGFTANGGVRLANAHIGGDLDFSGASITAREDLGEPALFADKVTVAQSMFCRDGFTADGEVNLVGARIGGNLEFIGASLSNRDGRALWADGLAVGGRMMCEEQKTAYGPMIWRRPFTTDGEVNLLGARIGSTLSFVGANLSNPDGLALTADHITVTQSMVCRDGFTAEGVVRLPNAHIGGDLDLSGATLTNLDGYSLRADNLRIDQSMLCRDGFAACGKVRLVGAHIGAQLQLNGATLVTPEGPAITLDLEGAEVGTLVLRPTAAPRRVDLALARIRVLADDQAKWPDELGLIGFTYDSLVENPRIPVKQRLDWLCRDPLRYSPQPYEQLAAVYRRAGREEDARRVAIASQRRRHRELGLPGRLWGMLLDALVGYGYRPWLAGGWLLLLLAIGTIIYQRAYPADMLPTKPGQPAPAFHAAVYSLDVLLPVVDLDQQSHWIPHGVALWWTWASILAGWTLTTAVVAALTGLFKRE